MLIWLIVCGRHGTGFGSWAGKWDLSKLVSAPLSALQQLGFSVCCYSCY